jgi:hypothetical protein
MQDYMLKFLKYEVNVSNLDLSTQSIKMCMIHVLLVYIYRNVDNWKCYIMHTCVFFFFRFLYIMANPRI